MRNLTIEQILALTSEQLEHIISLEMMDKGVPIVNERPVAPTTDVPTKDVTLFKFNDKLYTTVEDAQAVKEFVLSKAPYKAGWSTPDKVSKLELVKRDNYDMGIDEITLWSKEVEDLVGPALDQAKRDKEAFEEATKAYDEAEALRREVRESVCEEYYWLTSMQDRVTQLHAKYLVYLQTDAEKAWTFFEMAYSKQLQALVVDDTEYLNGDSEYFLTKLKAM